MVQVVEQVQRVNQEKTVRMVQLAHQVEQALKVNREMTVVMVMTVNKEIEED